VANIRPIALRWFSQKYGTGGWIKASRFYPPKKSWTKSTAWAFLIPLRELQAASVGTVELLCQKHNGAQDFHRLSVPCSHLLNQIPNLDIRQTKSGKAIRLFLETAGGGMFADGRAGGPVSLASFLVP
jgi:hypothetical protein